MTDNKELEIWSLIQIHFKTYLSDHHFSGIDGNIGAVVCNKVSKFWNIAADNRIEPFVGLAFPELCGVFSCPGYNAIGWLITPAYSLMNENTVSFKAETDVIGHSKVSADFTRKWGP